MGFYADRVLPHVVDLTCGSAALDKQRRRVCAGLHGEVLEIGFGSGRNVPFYPPDVTRVSAVEPADEAWRMAGERVAASPVPVDRSGLDGQSLPFDDGRFDCAVSTFTLCTIPDVATALAELRRVLRPGGTIAFFEHGSAPDAGVLRWQRRLEPFQKRFAGGCHLTRDIPALFAEAGFDLPELATFYAGSTPKPYGAMSMGVAHR